MSCLGVIDTPGEGPLILPVRDRDCMSTMQNGEAAYSQSHAFARLVSRCLPCGFCLPECPSPVVGPP